MAPARPEAVEALCRSGPLDVLITDQLMAQMTGIELARTAVAEWPKMPILKVFGYSDAIGMDSALPPLEKQFLQADLARPLASLMANAAAWDIRGAAFQHSLTADG